MDDEEKRIRRCRFSHPVYEDGIKHICVANGWEDGEAVHCTEEMCDSCSKFDSKYIEYPISVSEIVNEKIEPYAVSAKVGDLVEIRPCKEECEGKSYLGVFLGELPIAITSSFDRESGVLTNAPFSNPAMYVFELKEIVYGCGSWWRKIDRIEDFKEISEEDIENTWYVKILKELQTRQEERTC